MKRLLYIILYVVLAASASAQVKLTLEDHDLLHQLSNTQYSVNAQGRTETWYRSLPHYIMAHLVYHWNRLSSKRKANHD